VHYLPALWRLLFNSKIKLLASKLQLKPAGVAYIGFGLSCLDVDGGVFAVVDDSTGGSEVGALM
jgi:hypothetical protein